jgi:hypothetical protein
VLAIAQHTVAVISIARMKGALPFRDVIEEILP